MKSACFLLTLFGIVMCQLNCDLQGPYACTGGEIMGMDFGSGYDDFFQYFTTQGDVTSTDSCSVQQQGRYVITGNSLDVAFEINDDECILSGDGLECEYIDSLMLSVSDDCSVVEGPSGEICTPADSKLI